MHLNLRVASLQIFRDIPKRLKFCVRTPARNLFVCQGAVQNTTILRSRHASANGRQPSKSVVVQMNGHLQSQHHKVDVTMISQTVNGTYPICSAIHPLTFSWFLLDPTTCAHDKSHHSVCRAFSLVRRITISADLHSFPVPPQLSNIQLLSLS